MGRMACVQIALHLRNVQVKIKVDRTKASYSSYTPSRCNVTLPSKRKKNWGWGDGRGEEIRITHSEHPVVFFVRL